eukprot:946462-Pyramimonas_sp.AAC.1
MSAMQKWPILVYSTSHAEPFAFGRRHLAGLHGPLIRAAFPMATLVWQTWRLWPQLSAAVVSVAS